ncbi:MAG: BatA domain-containing protein, partial [Planctomycetaceae bacterium]|nr:BatA domain-containing protein [Planctomycetaceae bacterium]
MDVLNPWMLFGLTALAVPILIHLLSRRRQDVVDWGAMQFLEPSPKARRSLFIENVVLLLVRMGLVAIVAVALARPWFEWPWLARWISSRPQDVAVILDGSYSLDRSDGPRTLADRLRRTAKEVLAELDAGDALQIYDSRETPLPVLAGYQSDKSAAWESVLDLPPVSGSADLVTALTLASQDLVQGTTLDREIVVLTDGQARSWRLGDGSMWDTLQAVREQSAIKPRVWVLTVSPDDPTPIVNAAVSPISLSRELLPPGSRVRLDAKVRAWGNAESLERDVQLEIDGRPAAEHIARVRIPPNGETPVSFELPFDKPGCHVLSLVLTDSDSLPADNRSSAVVEVGKGWPVLLVDGATNDDPTKSETFFLAAALDPTGTSGWITPTVVKLADWEPKSIAASSAVVLANVAELTDEQVKVLNEYLANGGAVVVTLGDQTVATTTEEPSALSRFVSLDLLAVAGDATNEDAATTLVAESLELPWQQRFRR